MFTVYTFIYMCVKYVCILKMKDRLCGSLLYIDSYIQYMNI